MDHGFHVAGLGGQVEEVVLVSEQVEHRMPITHITDVHLDRRLQIRNVEQIPAILRNEAVDERYVRAQPDESAGEIGPDQAEPASDENPGLDECHCVNFLASMI